MKNISKLLSTIGFNINTLYSSTTNTTTRAFYYTYLVKSFKDCNATDTETKIKTIHIWLFTTGIEYD